MEKKNIVKEKAFLFAIEIVGLYKVLAERKVKIENARSYRKQKNLEDRLKNMH